jgi:hypothetical protein
VKERRKEDLDVFKGRRLFVGVARVERFSGKVGWWLACLVRGGVTSGEGKPKQETARPGECRRILIRMKDKTFNIRLVSPVVFILPRSRYGVGG